MNVDHIAKIILKSQRNLTLNVLRSSWDTVEISFETRVFLSGQKKKKSSRRLLNCFSLNLIAVKEKQLGYLRFVICDLSFLCGFLSDKMLSFCPINVLLCQHRFNTFCLLYFLNRESSPICCSGWDQNGDECTVREYWCNLLMYFNKKWHIVVLLMTQKACFPWACRCQQF